MKPKRTILITASSENSAVDTKSRIVSAFCLLLRGSSRGLSIAKRRVFTTTTKFETFSKNRWSKILQQSFRSGWSKSNTNNVFPSMYVDYLTKLLTSDRYSLSIFTYDAIERALFRFRTSFYKSIITLFLKIVAS